MGLRSISSFATVVDERLLAAARSENEDLLLEIFEEGNFDINATDGYVLEKCALRCLLITTYHTV